MLYWSCCGESVNSSKGQVHRQLHSNVHSAAVVSLSCSRALQQGGCSSAHFFLSCGHCVSLGCLSLSSLPFNCICDFQTRNIHNPFIQKLWPKAPCPLGPLGPWAMALCPVGRFNSPYIDPGHANWLTMLLKELYSAGKHWQKCIKSVNPCT